VTDQTLQRYLSAGAGIAIAAVDRENGARSPSAARKNAGKSWRLAPRWPVDPAIPSGQGL